MKPYASLPLATSLAALAVGASVVMAAPEAKAICIGGNNPCSTFNPVTDSTPQDVSVIGSITASNTANNRLLGFGVQFSFAPDAIKFNAPLEIKNISVFNAPGAAGLTNFGNLVFPGFDDSGKTTGFITFGTPLTSNINFATAGTKLSFTIPAGFANVGGMISANLIYDKSGTGTDGTSQLLDFEAVPGPLPLLGAASAFGFSRSLRRRIKLSANA